jgi:hypothetical protein
MTKIKRSIGSFVVCIDCSDDDVDLSVGKLYRVAKPERTDPPSRLRVVDDSGEDYLYPKQWFVPLTVPPKARRALAAPARSNA